MLGCVLDRRSGDDLDHERGIVDEDVDAAEFPFGGSGHCGDGGLVRDVSAYAECLAASGGDFCSDGLGAVFINVGNDHGCTCGRETQGISATDGISAPTGAGDDGHFAVKAELVD